MKSVSTLVIVCLTCWLVTLAGCGRDTVDAIPRKSAFKPVFGAEKVKTAAPSANSLDLSFLNEDHFACFCVDVHKVISNSDLADVPWDTLEKQLEKMVGQENSRMSGIDRVWLLLDRESFSMMTNGQQSSPMVLIMDFKSPLNEKQLAEAAAKRTEMAKLINNKKDSTDNAFSVEKIADQRVAFGNRDLIAKLRKGNGSSNLASQLNQMKLDSDIEGVISLAPIRSTLQSIFDMAAQFGGETYSKFARLPEATRRIEFKLSLDAKDMLVTTVYIDDDELTKEITRMASDASTQDSSLFGGGLPFGQGMGGQQSESMVPETSSGLAQEVGKEIKEENLFSVAGADQKVTFTLQRPSKLKELITASIHDAKRQFEFAERVQNLRSVAAAMQKYQDEYGCFPPEGIELENADGLPDQFSWRVGILPFLGEQDLYDQFDFKQPWDSVANLEVAKKIPDVFAVQKSDESDEIDSIMTRFHVTGGELGLYKENRIPKLSDISDKKIWTVVIIEGAPDSSVTWTKPGSLPISQPTIGQFGIEDEKGILFTNAAFDTRILRKDREKLRAILTPAGGEGLVRKDFLPIMIGQ